MITLHSFCELAHVRSAFEPQADKVNIERLAPQVPAAHPIFQPGEDEMTERRPAVDPMMIESKLLHEFRYVLQAAWENDQWMLAESIAKAQAATAAIIDVIVKAKAAEQARLQAAAVHAQRAELGLPETPENGSDKEPKRHLGRPAKNEPKPSGNGEEKGSVLYPSQ